MKYSEEFNTIVGYARDEALRTGSPDISPDHLVLGILRHAENNACKALEALGVNLAAMKKSIEEPIFNEQGMPYSALDDIRLSQKAAQTIATAVYEARNSGAVETLAAHLLLASLNSDGCAARGYLSSFGITHVGVEDYLKSNEMLGAPSGRKKLRKLTFVIPAGGNKFSS